LEVLVLLPAATAFRVVPQVDQMQLEMVMEDREWKVVLVMLPPERVII
jgi:hypothetical protein